MTTATLPKPYDRTTYDGRTVDWLTRAALEEAASRLMYADGLTLLQGSYTSSNPASGGTHDGGGVVDLAPADDERKVRILRSVGFAAWYRPELWRNGVRIWGAHIHAVLIGNRNLSPSAKAQVVEYLAGYDGLSGDGRDTGPRRFTRERFHWRTGQHRITRAGDLIARAQAKLSRGIRGYPAVARALKALGVAERRLPKGT